MNNHIAKSGENVDSSKSHSVPTSVRKATTLLNDEYLKNLSAASDNNYCYFRCQCHHSFRKNDPPHNLKAALCIFSGEVTDASCSCVAGQVGFCNHILALLLKLCKFSLYESFGGVLSWLSAHSPRRQIQGCKTPLGRLS